MVAHRPVDHRFPPSVLFPTTCVGTLHSLYSTVAPNAEHGRDFDFHLSDPNSCARSRPSCSQPVVVWYLKPIWQFPNFSTYRRKLLLLASIHRACPCGIPRWKGDASVDDERDSHWLRAAHNVPTSTHIRFGPVGVGHAAAAASKWETRPNIAHSTRFPFRTCRNAVRCKIAVICSVVGVVVVFPRRDWDNGTANCVWSIFCRRLMHLSTCGAEELCGLKIVNIVIHDSFFINLGAVRIPLGLENPDFGLPLPSPWTSVDIFNQELPLP